MLLLLFQIISTVYSLQLSNIKRYVNLNFHSSNSICNTHTSIPQWSFSSKYTQHRYTSSYTSLYGTKEDVKEGETDIQMTKRTHQKRDSTDIDWHYHYDALKHYLYNYKTTIIPISTIYNCTLPVLGEPWNTYNYNGKLGKWLQEQKMIFKQYESNLKEKPIQWLAREKLLQELVDQKLIQWDDAKLMPGSELGYHPWYIHYAALLHYYQVYGTCNVPLKTSYPCILKGYGIRGSSYYYDGHLGKWVNQQLRILNNMCDEKLSPLQIRKFQSLIRKGMLRMYHIYDETSEFERHIKRTTWEQHFDALIQYARLHGTCNVPRKTTFRCVLKGKGDNNTDYMYNENLGEWVHRQRKYRKSSWRTALTRNRFDKLQVLEDDGIFSFYEDDFMEFQTVNYKSNSRDYSWDFHFSALLEYGREYGTCNIPPKNNYLVFISNPNSSSGGSLYMGKLGRWLANQRKRYTLKTLSTYKLSQFMELVNEGMLRLVIHKRELFWMRNYQALLQYGNTTGHHNVPMITKFKCRLPGLGMNGEDYEYNLNLGTWLCYQRSEYHNGRLLYHRKMKLQELVNKGTLLWNATNLTSIEIKRFQGNKNWPLNYAALLDYGVKYGTCNIPQKATYECILPGMGDNGEDYHYKGNLGIWLDNQKQQMRNGKLLDIDRLKKLQQLIDQGLVDMDRRNTNKMIQRSLAYNEREWPRHYAALLHYNKTYGSGNVPYHDSYECILPGMGDNGEDFEYNRKLGTWVSRQREYYAANKLRADRVEKLQLLVDQGLFLWNARHMMVGNTQRLQGLKDWPRYYAALLHYGNRFGTCNVPIKESYECILPGMGDNGEDYHYKGRLGRWLSNQKYELKTGRLSDDRIAMLQQLADQGLFDWVSIQRVTVSY